MESLLLGFLGIGSLAGIASFVWHLVGQKATTQAEALATKGVDAGFGALEKLPIVQKHQAALVTLDKADSVVDDVVVAQLANLSAQITKNGFTAAMVAELGPSSLAALKATISQEEHSLLASTGDSGKLVVKSQAAVTKVLADVRNVKLATGEVVKLPVVMPLPPGAELVAA